MNRINSILNNIYCLSQGAASPIINLRAYPQVAKNSDIHKLLMHIRDLHEDALIICMDIEGHLLENRLETHLSGMFIKGQAIEEIYIVFVNNISLPENHILVKKLRSQLNNILSAILKLEQTFSNISLSNHFDFISP